ncbi:MAG TPA: Fic family protein [Candidatus Pacearchaeota archaeon]|nr:Fic family protein [Candidatus Pacearchaeota archaeon]
MVYHEIRIVNGQKMNYLINNQREDRRWKKTAKFIGAGKLDEEEVRKLKKEFEIELKLNKKYKYLQKKKVLDVEKLVKGYDEGIKKLSKEEFIRFEKSFFTELTYNSNAIEGNSLSLEETSIVINEGLSPEGKTLREVYEAKNHMKALELIRNYKGVLNEQFILKIHSIILNDISERFAGKYRENPVRVIGSDFHFPSPEKIPQLMGNLIYWYNKNKKNMHPLELAIIFSMKFVSIHPFIDGNGRVSRLIMNFILQKKRYPWINIYNKQRQKYLKAVRKANNEDYSEIINFLIEVIKENMKDFGFLE